MEVSEKRLAIALTSVFGLGILLSILNGSYIEDTGSSMPVVVYGVTAVSMGVGALIILMFQWKVTQRQAYSMLKVLPAEERKIIEVLLKEGKMEQMYLVAETGISKVKVSRVLSKLEQRGVVEKKPLGNTNLVKLKL
ncbi:MAG: hypothetical protein GF416_04810 [Candidatus Altiarchaeales archaeon]|nr:hypothetical protein [Candidatus Altiarchaeales archaeon]MBD3416441.1 hypothetical protein [Candidatus Altiarchaeales archaeon]